MVILLIVACDAPFNVHFLIHQLAAQFTLSLSKGHLINFHFIFIFAFNFIRIYNILVDFK